MLSIICFDYEKKKTNVILNRGRIHAGVARDVRKTFKRMYGGAAFILLRHFSMNEILTTDTRKLWTRIASNSSIFHNCAGTVDCILNELKKYNGTLRVIKIPKGSYANKKALNMLNKSSIKETQFIKWMYDRVSKYDNTYSGDEEARKLKWAIKFIRTGIMVYYFNKLPTHITIDEYEELRAINAQNTEARYERHDATNDYVRVGGLTRKSAVKLFGVDGAAVLLRKKIQRYDSIYSRFYECI